jgi:hypothetical protein
MPLLARLGKRRDMLFQELRSTAQMISYEVFKSTNINYNYSIGSLNLNYRKISTKNWLIIPFFP